MRGDTGPQSTTNEPGGGRGSLLKDRLLSNTSWAFGGKIATAFVVLACNAFLARLLTPEEMGSYFLAYSIVLMGSMLGSLGLKQAVVRFIAQSVGLGQFSRTRHAVRSVLWIGTLGALGTGLLYLAFGRILGERLFNAPALVAVTSLVAGWIAIMTLQGIQAEAFRGFHDVRLATIFENLATVGPLTVCLALIWLIEGQAQLATVILFAILSATASVLVANRLLRRRVASLPEQDTSDSGTWGSREMLIISLPLLVNMMMLSATTYADIWIVGAFLPKGDVALYGAASRLVNQVAMPLFIINAVVPPMIAELYAQGRTRTLELVLRASATVAGIPAIFLMLVFTVGAGPVMILVYGDYYGQGASVLAVMSVGKLVSVWSGSCGLVLMMTGNQNVMAWITFTTTIATMVLAGLCAEPFGIEGVAAVVSGGIAIRGILMVIIAKRRTGIQTNMGLSGFSELKKFAKGAIAKKFS